MSGEQFEAMRQFERMTRPTIKVLVAPGEVCLARWSEITQTYVCIDYDQRAPAKPDTATAVARAILAKREAEERLREIVRSELKAAGIDLRERVGQLERRVDAAAERGAFNIRPLHQERGQ